MYSAYYRGYRGRRVKSITFPIQCRYCGKNVFCYKNEYGSRVLFEDLGVPLAETLLW